MKAQPVYSTFETLQQTYNEVAKLIDNNIQGCLVECGVAAGSQIAAMQECLTDLQTVRKIYGYDSFEGIPFAGIHDGTQPGIGEIDATKLDLLETSGISSHDIDNVLRNFNQWGITPDNLTLIKGWFQHTVHKHTEPIALLRLDGDLYTSTKVCLQHLLPLVVNDGCVIIDDYGLEGCAKAVHEVIDKDKLTMIGGIAYYYVIR